MANATVSRVDLALLRDVFEAAGEPPYRAGQVWEWAARGAASYAAMTNVPAALRARLAAEVPFSTLDVEREERARDGTAKTLFRTRDGHPVEAVLMRYRDGRRSLCLSSQSGCPASRTSPLPWVIWRSSSKLISNTGRSSRHRRACAMSMKKSPPERLGPWRRSKALTRLSLS